MKGGSLDWRQYMMIGDYVWFVPLDTSNHACDYTCCKYHLNCLHSQQIGTNAYTNTSNIQTCQHLQYCGVVICFLPLVLLLVWFASNFLCHRGDLEGQNQSLCWQSCEIRNFSFSSVIPDNRQLVQRAGGWGTLAAPKKSERIGSWAGLVNWAMILC